MRSPLVVLFLGILPLALIVAGTTAPSDAQPAPSLRDSAAAAGVFIGASLEPGSLSDPSFADTLSEEFNSLTAENRMKWQQIHPQPGQYVFAPADELVAFAELHSMRVRGHTLLWADPTFIPGYVNAATTATELRDILEEHIATVAGHYAGRIAQWDVINEPLEIVGPGYRQNVFLDLLGPDYIAEAFELAHAADPDAQLFLNEFITFYPGAKTQALISLVEDLLAEGVPIHGVGIQAHFIIAHLPIPLPPPAQFQKFLQALADLGVAVELTELDISINYFLAEPDPLAPQAEYFGQIVAACMAVSACEGITTWNLHDGETWLDVVPPFDQFGPHRPLLFDEALQPKPAYFAVYDAILARIPGDTDADGCTNARENGPNPQLGGLRDYLNFWDFFDTPNASNLRDRAVTIADIFAVAGRFGATGDPGGDPLGGPIPAPPAYHTGFDRGEQVGSNTWNRAPADGAIAIADIFAVAAQFGHICG